MSPKSTEERLARLLAVVPWVAAHDGPTLAEVSRRFSVSEEDLVDDLNLLFMCGVYPFTPDALIEVDIEAGRVWIRFADWFRRPLRLSAREALALVAAGRAVLSAPAPLAGAGAEGPLATAVRKLEAALGAGAEGAVEVEPGEATPEVLAALRTACERHRKVRICYYSFGRDVTTERVVHPWEVFSAEGHWYLLGWCELAEGRRLFRVDRVQSAQVCEEGFEPPADIGPPGVYHSRPDDPLVVLDLAPEARWVAERYPHEGAKELPSGHLRVCLRASSRAWLERLLLRAGPSARVVSGAEGVAAAAARRVLARYGHVASKGDPSRRGAGSAGWRRG
jgi:proteasome accessory factor C